MFISLSNVLRACYCGLFEVDIKLIGILVAIHVEVDGYKLHLIVGRTCLIILVA